MTLDMTDLSARQLRDWDARTPGTMFAEKLSLSQEQAYAIQSEVCRLREQRGETVVGYKIGCTSPGIQQQLGINHRVFGRLFDSQRWPSGISLPRKRFSGLAIEGELAVQLAFDLPAVNLSESSISQAIESVFPVIELHNLVFRRAEPTAEELIANNAIHAGFVYATNPSPTLDVDLGTLSIDINDDVVATVPGTELTATVIDSLSWLAKELQRLGSGLKAGQTILCGSVADLIPVSQDCQIAVTTDRFGSVKCTIDENSGFLAETSST